jgi:hypothetical protein
MNVLYIIGGFIFLGYGVYLTIKEINIFRVRKQNEFGWDIKGLGAGICCIIVGIYLLTHYF